MAPRSLLPSPLRFSLVGPGRVGSSLAHWLVGLGARLEQVAGRSASSGAALVARLGGRAVAVDELKISDHELLLIAVPDPTLKPVVSKLLDRPMAAVVLHTSGRYSAEILGPLREGGAAIGSLHPLKAFPGILQDSTEAHGTVFAVDGDEVAESLARRLCSAWGGVSVEIPPQHRSLYHLAASIAAGGVVTLVACAKDLAVRLNLPPEVGGGYLQLAQGALEQAGRTDSIEQAITGPVARGEMEEFRRQLTELRQIDADLATLIEAVAARTRHLLR